MTTNEETPLVSCLCVTRGKPQKLQKAIQCFQAQSYHNRELIIVFEDDDLATIDFVRSLDRDQGIRCLKLGSSPKLTLGQLRNRAIEFSKGTFFCQWDDDDWYHCDRLSVQLTAAMSGYNDASVMTNWILFDEIERQGYFSLFRLWEGSVLCKKEVVNKELCYPSMSKGEDSIFINNLVEAHRVIPVINPNLYIYSCNGANVSSRGHFDFMFSRSQRLSPRLSKTITDILHSRYSIEEGSEILNTKEVLAEFKYFAFNNINITNEEIAQYLKTTNTSAQH